MIAHKRLAVFLGLTLLSTALLVPGGAHAAFGIEPGSLSAVAREADGTPALQAGSHPFDYTVSFTMNQDSENLPEGVLGSVIIDLPPGLVGNPLAVPRCKTSELAGIGALCPGNTQVGIAHIPFGGVAEVTQPIYNLTPVLGSPARFGFSLANLNSFQEPFLRSDGDYGISVADFTIPNIEIQAITETFWGIPADTAHDAERQCVDGGGSVVFGCASTLSPAPFLTLPTSCSGPLQVTLHASSAEEPDIYDTETYESEAEGSPIGMNGCNALAFEPSISSQPTTNLADSPTGLEFNLHQPQADDSPQGPPSESCSRGEWEGEPTEFAFQWLRNGVPIPGATGPEYTPAGADASTVLQCEVTATNPAAAGPGHVASLLKILPPEPSIAPPEPEIPFVSVNAEAETATCVAEFWSGEPTFTYRWFRDGALVPGENGDTLPVPAGSAPYTLQCEALGTNAGGTAVRFSENATSSPPLEPAIPTFFARPRISPGPPRFPLSTAHLKDVVVALPQGVSLNPSAGAGLAACANSQIGFQSSGGQIHFSKSPQSCPNASKIATLEVSSPLVDHEISGAVFVAEPFENPFGTLLGIYLAIEDEQSGIVAKLAGKVEPDPITGQLTARFKDNPQLPIEDIDVHFFNGPRAALKTPLTCGKYTTTSTLTPWSTPEGADVHPSSSFETSVPAGGSGACPTSEGRAPNQPSFTAGTIVPQAAAYSPFVLKLSRRDGTQRLTGLDAFLPKGLTGKLAGIPYCSEAQIAAAKAREAPDQGALEQSSPSCPLASEVGSVTVGAGAGITPLYVGGHGYLAGPYKGAPISLVVIVPAVAGPFDLGAVVSRAALYVNSETAQIHAVSDSLPSIIQGIPLDLRSIVLKTDRPDFTLNPTSCDPMQITAAATALTGQSAALTSPFQVGGCSALKFKPKLAISLKGGTKRSKNPALKAVLTYPKGGAYANIASAQVTLPHSAFLEQAHIGTICTRVQFAANACPKASIYGFARAFTPLLDKPVEGPVYLRSSSHELPDLVAALEGQVDVDLVGRVDTGKGGGIRNTFEATPDAPVSKFVLEMKGGKKGLLVNSENICKKPQKAIVSYTAHNGAAYEAQPLIKNDCGKGRHSKKKGRR